MAQRRTTPAGRKAFWLAEAKRLPGCPKLSAAQVGELIGCSDWTVRGIDPERLPYVPHGARGVRRYALADVRAYARSLAVGRLAADLI